MKVKTSKGFTLAELLIVMAIITVLAAVAIPTFGRQLETARESTDIEVVRSAYTEALTAAVLDSVDGQLDGRKYPGTGDDGKLTFTGITIGTSSDSGTTNTYKVTLASLDSKPTFAQTTSGWQYVNNMVAGVACPATDKTMKTVQFTFTIGTDGNVKFVTGDDATPITIAAS